LYQACDGLTINVNRPLETSIRPNYVPAFRILPLNEAITVYGYTIAEPGFPELKRIFGLLPFTDAFDSDPYCYACKSTLRGRVLHVRHDSYPASIPVSRSLESFLRLVWTALHIRGDLDFVRHGCDYSEWIPLRTPEDDLAAKELLRLAAGNDVNDEVCHLCRQWAAAMLGPESLSEFADILDWGDESGRSVAFARLCQFASPGADRLLRNYQARQRRFLERLQDTFEKAGFDARQKEGSLQVKGVGWINVQQLFTDRRDPAVLREMLTRERRQKRTP
jgi:hypothetical protein